VIDNWINIYLLFNSPTEMFYSLSSWWRG